MNPNAILHRFLSVFACAFSKITSVSDLTWDRDTFIRGWLITGDLGTGKTAGAVVQSLHNLPPSSKPIFR